MRKKIITGLLAGLLGFTSVFAASILAPGSNSILSEEVSAQRTTHVEGSQILWITTPIANINADGSWSFIPNNDPDLSIRAQNNALNLEALLLNDEVKTLIIPSGSVVEVEQVVDIGSNTTIIAEGATIIQTISEKGILKHGFPDTYSEYGSICNVSISGGTWKCMKTVKTENTIIRFCNGQNLNFTNMNIISNYQGHGLELIGCKNVTVKGCKCIAEGEDTKDKNSVEEALQIDLITKTTAPGVYRELSYFAAPGLAEAYMTGLACENVLVDNCEISASRGLCCNYAPKESQAMQNIYHKNITVTNCKLTGESAEGLMIFNTKGIVVKNNIIKTNSKRTKESYSDGLHIVNFSTDKSIKNSTIVISGNTVYGKYNALGIASKTSAKFGKTTVSNNKLYCKSGKKNAYLMPTKYFKKLTLKKNTCQKW